MIGKVDDNTLIDTMSEYLCNTYFLNYENYAHTYLTFYVINHKMNRCIVLVCFGRRIRSRKQNNKTA
jgi:hypothetical protein